MLRTYAAHVAMFTVLYRGYDIEVSPEPSGWRAGVYPRSADLPILCRNEVHACDQDEAVIEAMDRVDGVLRRQCEVRNLGISTEFLSVHPFRPYPSKNYAGKRSSVRKSAVRRRGFFCARNPTAPF